MQLTTTTDHPIASRRSGAPAWKILLLLLALAGSFNAAAQCASGNTCVSGSGPSVPVAVTGRINVSPDTPPGAAISDRIQLPGYSIAVQQAGAPNVSGAFTFNVVAGNLSAGFDDVYNTNVPGIGVRYYFTFPPHASLNPAVVGDQTLVDSTYRWTFAPPANGGPWGVTVGRSVQFVNLTQGAKSGTITSVPIVDAAAQTSSQPGANFGQTRAYNGTVTGGTLAARTCTLQPVPDIVLPQAPARDLPSVGSTTSPRNFTIAANCSGPLVFSLRFNTATSFENASISLLRNTVTGTSGAAGYAIQIVEGGTGAAIDATTKQYVTTVDSSTFRQDFTARYYRFGATPTGGRIQSVLIYTLDYR
jgi:hypothetical protein